MLRRTAEKASASLGDERLPSKASILGVFGLRLPSDDGGEAARVSGELAMEGGPEKANAEKAEASEFVGDGVS